MPYKPELLAPAGDMPCLLAAINSGCDAVYIGMKNFGARAAATNFDGEQLQKARELTALYGIKLYITLNTLIKQNEIENLLNNINLLANIGVNAIIVQDIGVVSLIKGNYPSMALHASTQMGINSAFGIDFLKQQGINRIVLPRETKLQTIKDVCKTGIETEVFVHGALCVAMSGQCFYSSSQGVRSGNRGRCAQPCRQSISFDGKKATWLSARDIMLYDNIKNLVNIGVTSFKIEGRMKRPAYVAQVCSIYRKALDMALQGKATSLSPSDKTKLYQVFNRGDFSQAYIENKRDSAIINSQRSNHNGLYIGKLVSVGKKLIEIKLDSDISNGDMLQIRKNQGQENDVDIIYSGKDSSANTVVSTYLREGIKLSTGLDVYRLNSKAQENEMQALKREALSVNVQLKLFKGEISSLKVFDDIAEYTAFGDVCQEPIKQALSLEKLYDVLNKTDKLNIALNNIDIKQNSVFLPVSSLNTLRREAYEGFMKQRIKHNTQSYTKANYIPSEANFKPEFNNSFIVISSNMYMDKSVLQNGDVFVYNPLDLRHKNLEQSLSQLDKNAYILLHTQLSDKLANNIKSMLDSNAKLCLDNIAQIGLGFKNIAFGTHVPITNRLAYSNLTKYKPCFISAYPEITQSQALQIGNIAYCVYGRQRLMILNHCPARTALNLSENKEACQLCHQNTPKSLLNKNYINQNGQSYPLRAVYTDEGCIVEMLSSKPMLITNCQTSNKIINFTTENLQTQQNIYSLFKQNRLYELANSTDYTLGHFDREVD